MILFNFNDLNKQSKIGYNALYNVVFSEVSHSARKNVLNSFTVPLCLNSDNKVSLTEKNFIFFDSVVRELKIHAFYTIELNNGRAIEDVKTDYSTVKVYWSTNPVDNSPLLKVAKSFDFSEVDTSKLLKRNGKAEKAKTAENKTAEAAKTAEAEKTAEALEAKTAEVENLKKEVAKKEEQLNKKAIKEFNDNALMSIADCVETLILKHCNLPKNFDFTAFEADLFKAIGNQWSIKD